MLHVGQRPEASLHTILEENPDSESQGSMETVATAEQLPFPSFRGGAIFNVSVDSPLREGETEEDRAAHINRNVNCAQHRANEAALALAEAAHNDQLDSQGRPRQLQRNLDDEFVRVERLQDPKRQLGRGRQRAHPTLVDTGGRQGHRHA